MSKSRTRDELTRDNFTRKSVATLDTINELFNFRDSLQGPQKRLISARLKKKIQNLRIVKNKFSF